MATTVENPIIPGFAPDPSVTRIGDAYFLVTSSFHLFPGLPIYTSTNLAEWTLIGNAINRTSQLSLSGSRVRVHLESKEVLVGAGGLYAATIRHHGSTTYITCTNVIHTKNSSKDDEFERPIFENFIIHTNDIWSGNWSDPGIYLWVSWNTIPSSINGFEIDLKSGEKIGSEQVVWEGFTRNIPEGPHIYRRNGSYYLLIAEGGTHDTHQISIAKSHSPMGPYEACEQNPILRPTVDVNNGVVYTGHGDLFQDVQGQYWMVCLGVRLVQGAPSVMGRESFLTRVRWAEHDDWPTIEQPIGLRLQVENVRNPSLNNFKLVPQDDPNWIWIRDPVTEAYNISADGSIIKMKPSDQGLNGDGEQPVSFIGKRQRKLVGEARVALLSPFVCNAVAGLTYYKDECRYISLALDTANFGIIFEHVNKGKRHPIINRQTIGTVEFKDLAQSGRVEFRLEYTRDCINFSYQIRKAEEMAAAERTDGEWISAPSVRPTDMIDQDFTGPCIGLFAAASPSSALKTQTNSEWCEFSGVDLAN